METDDEYVESLESVLAQFLKPLKGIPFSVVMKSLAQKAVLPFDNDKPELALVLQKVESAATVAGREANRTGIFTARPNEAGNAIEPFVQNALRQSGLMAEKPLTVSAKQKTLFQGKTRQQNSTFR
jgi:hypothetical protein